MLCYQFCMVLGKSPPVPFTICPFSLPSVNTFIYWFCFLTFIVFWWSVYHCSSCFLSDSLPAPFIHHMTATIGQAVSCLDHQLCLFYLLPLSLSPAPSVYHLSYCSCYFLSRSALVPLINVPVVSCLDH